MKLRSVLAGALFLVCILFVAPSAFSQGMSMMGGGGGMITPASDGSLLISEMSMDGMGGGDHGGGSGGEMGTAELLNVTAAGTIRWRIALDGMGPIATNGDLVVRLLMDMTMDDEGNHGGGEPAVLVGHDLATGRERWRTTLPGEMAMGLLFSSDGTRLYVESLDMGSGGNGGHGKGKQATDMSMGEKTLVAIDRTGKIVWTLDLSSGGGGMGSASRDAE